MEVDYFDGTSYVCWKDKMLFLLTILKISYILKLTLPTLSPSTPKDYERVKADWKKYEEDELLYRGYILNNLLNRLYDLFISIKSLKEI